AGMGWVAQPGAETWQLPAGLVQRRLRMGCANVLGSGSRVDANGPDTQNYPRSGNSWPHLCSLILSTLPHIILPVLSTIVITPTDLSLFIYCFLLPLLKNLIYHDIN
ncbi:unnamed protein product, partial [Rhizoctonia solani]